MSEHAAHGREPFAHEGAGFDYFTTAMRYARLARDVYNHLEKTRGVALVTGHPLPAAEILFDHLPSHGGHWMILECPAAATPGDLMNLYAASLETGGQFVDEGRRWPTASAQTPPGAMPILVLAGADRLSDEALVELNRSHADPSRPLLVLTGAEGFVARLRHAAPDMAGSGTFAHFPVQHLARGEVADFIDFQIGIGHGGRAVFRPEIIDLISVYADGDPATVNGLARRILNAANRLAGDSAGSVPEGEPADAEGGEAGPKETEVPSEADYPLADAAETGAGRGAVLDGPPLELIRPEAAATMAPQSGPAVLDEQPAFTDRNLGAVPVPLSSDAETDSAPVPSLPSGTVEAGEGRAGEAAEEVAPVPDSLAETASMKILRPDGFDPVDAIAPVGGEAMDFDPLRERGRDMDGLAVPPASGSETAAVSQSGGDEAQTEVLDDDWDELPPATDFARSSHAGPAHRGGRLVGWIAAGLAVFMVSSGALVYVRDAERPPSAGPVSKVANSVHESLDLKPIPVAQAVEKPVAMTPATVPAPPPLVAMSEPREAIGGSGTTVSSVVTQPKPLDQAKPSARPVESAVAPQPLPAEPAKTDAMPKEAALPPRESMAMAEPPATVQPANLAPEVAKPEARPVPAAAAADEIALLLQRGDQLLLTGDIASARRFFERAADRGDSTAATRLAKTYDPLYLQQSGVRGVLGDPVKAVAWYRKGISGGDVEAEMRLQQLRAKFSE